nr:MAG TPA: hypothetical protein [Caudoviricetes sp.]
MVAGERSTDQHFNHHPPNGGEILGKASCLTTIMITI